MRHEVILTLVLTIFAGVAPVAGADGSHPIAQPLRDASDAGEWSFAVEAEAVRIPTDHLSLAAQHIIDQQCDNGGFGWPHADCSATHHNITGPILLGVLGAYSHTRETTDLLGATHGGIFELGYEFPNGEARFGTFTPFFMLSLSRASGIQTFADFTANEFFDALHSGTYGPDDLDAAGWIAEVEAGRTGAWVNLRSWEFHNLIPTAEVLGQPGQSDLFAQAVLDGLATLDNTDPDNVYSDIVGLAGAVRGLAFARSLSFPSISAPLHPGVDGIDNLEDLVAYLASLQNPDGSWYWHSNLAAPVLIDEGVQTTAYATLALLEADIATAASYQPATESARDWMASLQLVDGGFPSWPGGDENTEIEGEALNAIADFDARLFVDGFESGSVALWDSVAP